MLTLLLSLRMPLLAPMACPCSRVGLNGARYARRTISQLVLTLTLGYVLRYALRCGFALRSFIVGLYLLLAYRLSFVRYSYVLRYACTSFYRPPFNPMHSLVFIL